MSQDTRPAELDPRSASDAWAEFRVDRPGERLRLLRELRDGHQPVVISSPGGATLSTTLWAVDEALQRLNFYTEASSPQVDALVESDETVAVAYLESVKLQFDLQGLVLVHGHKACTLQTGLPHEIYRFQRRQAYRVRTVGRDDPHATLRHPSLPDMELTLRVLDVSSGGCALWLPAGVPPLQAGTRIGEVKVELDSDTRFMTGLLLQHLSSSANTEREAGGGVRLGCEWQGLGGVAQRALQHWIDHAQKRRRFLQLR